MTELTQEKLKELLHYDADTGIFTWKKFRGGFAKKGSIAGYFEKDGYRAIAVSNKIYRAHRLAWLYVYGVMPDKEIDHKDGNPVNNAISNLRLATRIQNCFNTKIKKNSTTGFKGVEYSKGRFQARARIGGVRYCLGTYLTAEEASTVYQAFIKQKHGEFYKRT